MLTFRALILFSCMFSRTKKLCVSCKDERDLTVDCRILCVMEGTYKGESLKQFDPFQRFGDKYSSNV